MTQINRLNSRIVKIERERDDLQRANFKLRDKLLEFAKSCARCGGTGMQTDYVDDGNRLIPEGDRRRDTGRAVTRECKDCADIREVLE